MPGTCGVHRRSMRVNSSVGELLSRWLDGDVVGGRLLAVGGYRVPADSVGAVPEFSSSVAGLCSEQRCLQSCGRRDCLCRNYIFSPRYPRYGVMTVVGKWSVCLAAAQVHWLGAFAWRLCLLVCAGQEVLRTVSVAVRVIGRLDARGHGHIADSVGAAKAER